MAALFDAGREMTCPRNSGKAFGEFGIEALRGMPLTLTAEEEASPCAKYYYLPTVELSAAHKEALAGGPMAPEDCYMPKEVGRRMLNTGCEKIENGYGVLPNGVGFAAINIKQTGRTDEKVKFYREKFAREGNLFYKAWYPGAHLVHLTNGAVENFGWGMVEMKFTIADFDLKIVNIDVDEVRGKDPNCISIFGAGSVGIPLDHPDKEEYVSMFCYTREIPEGRELRIRYWSGLLFQADGSVKRKIHVDREEMMGRIYLQMKHCMVEYTNETRLMNLFWEEHHQKTDKGAF